MNSSDFNSLESGIEPSGNSMYNAVIAALQLLDPSLLAKLDGSTPGERMIQLRKLVSEQLGKKIENRNPDNCEWYDTFMSNIRPRGSQDSDDIIIINYLTNIEISGNEGDHIVLQMLAEIFNIQIILHDDDTTMLEIGIENNPTIDLYLIAGYYYDYLEPLLEAEELPLAEGALLSAAVMAPPAVGMDLNDFEDIYTWLRGVIPSDDSRSDF